jgi:hypothetical protein
MSKSRTKTLDDIKSDMSALYDNVVEQSVDLKTAAELANIAGKFLKAEQLQLAREIFLSQSPNATALKREAIKIAQTT